MAARAIGTGTISFGLVSIPVKLYTATSSEAVSFNLIHQKCKGRIKQQIFCPTDNEIVERNDLVKGYEYAKNQYVLFTEEELDALEAAKTNSLEIVEFVPANTVDWIYISKTYYLGPDKGGDKAYKLLSAAMERTKKIAVGRYFTRGKEQLVLLRPYKNGLMLHYAYYANEVRSFDEVDTGAVIATKPIEDELADKLIAQLTIPEFNPEQYRDEYVERVKAAVEQKVAFPRREALPTTLLRPAASGRQDKLPTAKGPRGRPNRPKRRCRANRPAVPNRLPADSPHALSRLIPLTRYRDASSRCAGSCDRDAARPRT